MNVQEGARRMRLVGQRMIFFPLSAILLIWGIAMVSALINRNAVGMHYEVPFLLLELVIPVVVPGAALWLSAWIVEGFGKNTH